MRPGSNSPDPAKHEQDDHEDDDQQQTVEGDGESCTHGGGDGTDAQAADRPEANAELPDTDGSSPLIVSDVELEQGDLHGVEARRRGADQGGEHK